jgi:collagenase-like PrtC family protease
MTESRPQNSSSPSPATERRLELLAPAGDLAALEAALEAGAGAVYFGLTSLNARRRAKNFRQEEFGEAVEKVHARGARAYLTLNIDLAERELGLAARILELARQHAVDAVLIRDPALLTLRREFPELEFHFSTQTCMANSADVVAAGYLGASRVVLARELTLAEITAASTVPGVQTEVFIQGALCFGISGRCLLSSWAGGRSGNRGACTSPCRVPWSIAGEPADTPLSMRDLATLERLGDLRRAGVAALKIEGRLKTPAWVRKAVDLYRRVLNGENPEQLQPQLRELGAYTGRELTCGYLDGQRDELIGVAGREGSMTDAMPSSDADEDSSEEQDIGPSYDLQIDVDVRTITCQCQCGSVRVEWSLPKTIVRRQHKAVAIGNLLSHLEQNPVQGYQLGLGSTNDPDFLLVPRAANSVIDRVSAIIRQARKASDGQVRVALTPEVRNLLEKSEPSEANHLHLGDRPDRVRLKAGDVAAFVRQVRPGALIVEGVQAEGLERVQAACHDVPLVVALPQVFFENELPGIRDLVRRCARAHVPVEVNSWGGWQLAKEAGAPIEGGPGLPVLNSLAARTLAECGMRSVTLSIEADRRQLEQVTAACPVACSLVVFGRPALVTTRVRMPEQYVDQVFADRRGIRLSMRAERGLYVFRPIEPFDLRACSNPRIRVAHLVVDLVGSSDPLADWYNAPLPEDEPFEFNYSRTLA